MDMPKHGSVHGCHVFEINFSWVAKQWKEIYKVAKSDLVILGRGASKAKVEDWIIAAAKSGVVSGFAIGRTIFYKPLEQFKDKKITRKQAVEKIAKNYLYFIKLWEKHEA